MTLYNQCWFMLIKSNVTTGLEWRFGSNWRGERCGAKTRKWTPCQRPANKKNGRCKLQGGASSGPRTEVGRARISGHSAWVCKERLQGLLAPNKTPHPCLHQFINQGSRSTDRRPRPAAHPSLINSKFEAETALVTPALQPRTLNLGCHPNCDPK